MPVVKTTAVGFVYQGYDGNVLSVADTISLQCNENNPHDKTAIKVIADGKFVGFIAKHLTCYLHPYLNQARDIMLKCYRCRLNRWI